MRRTGGLSAPESGFLHVSSSRRISGISGVTPPAVLQSASTNYAAGPTALPFGSNVAGNSLLVCCLGCDSGSSGTVTDSQSNTWTRAQHLNSTTGQVEVWSALTSHGAGACTVTLSAAASANVGGLIFEVSNITAALPVDSSATSFSNTVAPVVGPNLSGLAGANDFVIYWAVFNPPGNAAVGGIWTSNYNALIAGQHFWGAAYATTGPTVTGPTINPGTNSTFGCVGVAFKPT